MSTDRTTEILNYLSAISREVGELRTEMREMRAAIDGIQVEQNNLRTELNAVRADVRMIIKQLDRIGAVVLENRADIRDVEDRVAVLEGKQS